MAWTSIRDFLKIPRNLTGKNINIAIIDGRFPHHPDISSDVGRRTFLVKTAEVSPVPTIMVANKEQEHWNKGLHGLWAAAAAAGSGNLSNGYYSGAAPEANLYLLETGGFNTSEEIESKFGGALIWLKENWRKYNIRGVVLTVTSSRDTGLLPWQADPVRILCEELVSDGLLVVSAVGNTLELTCNGPAASPSVLSVGGVVVPHDGEMIHSSTYHSCRGFTFENKWVPEIVAQAENIVLPMPFQSEEERMNHYTATIDELPRDYARTEGTSFAGPIILGTAACIWEAHPDWSAFQVKSVMINSGLFLPSWVELRSGLVDVSAAINSAPEPKPYYTETPFSRWNSWKQKTVEERLETIKGYDEELVTEALLSFFSENIPKKLVKFVQELLRHSSYRIRTTAIVLLSSSPQHVESSQMSQLLMDSNSYVRMGALYTLSKCPDLWEPISGDLIALFSDGDSDIVYCSLNLASKIKSSSFVKPIISALKSDAINKSVSTFGARLGALEEITGIRFSSSPEWQEGMCWYSERSTQIRLSIAQKWLDWLEIS
ncbi:S8 family serine peptidase [Bacillus sp. FJAT-28004]|uniref:S8 family serine peptidase n=1 Tax=Bacillus sp. FJAT-28004 TaxID=1679165 RepID=UPI0006B44CF3|nr:S8 family serine peptidase [Bacillus sp. FJAT-28004]